MDGERIKYEIKKKGFTMKRVAKELKQSQQNLSAKLNTDDVSSELIEQICDIIGVRVAELYIDGDIISAINNSTAFKGTQSCDPRLLDIIQARDAQNGKSQAQIDRLIAIIEKMQKQ